MSRFAHGIYHEYIPALYSHRDCSAALKSSVQAVGLATLSLVRSESRLLEEARRHHSAAVKQVQLSLQSHATVSRADTLASVMLFALFAGITCESTAAHINWTKHIKGALAILNSRSYLLDDDPVVNILSSHVTSCVLVDCLQSAEAPPSQFNEIKFEPRIPINFQEKSEYVLELLAQIRPQLVTFDNFTDMFRKLDIIDSHLDDLFAVLTKKHPRVILSNEASQNQPNHHIYSDLKSVRVWNIVRLTKLSSAELRYDKVTALQRLQLNHSRPKSPTEDLLSNQAYASSLAELLIHDICASVPECIRTIRRSKSADPTIELNTINWAHSLLWPLSAAHASRHAPVYLREYMRETLQKMWDVTKFPIVDYHQSKIEDEPAPHIW